QVMIPKENGSWLYLIDLEHALRVAGIRIKGEEHGNKTRR
ncbi:ead/Ea22-like family protein, partial [Escherichia coli]